MCVERICVHDVDVAYAEESVIAAAQRMQARKVGTLVVIGMQQEPVGLITDRDLTVRVLGRGRDPWHTTVRDVMTETPGLIDGQMPVEAALRVMRAKKCRRLPVVDDAGKLTGIVSLDDIIRSLTDELHEISLLLEEESPQSLYVDATDAIQAANTANWRQSAEAT